MKEFIFDELVIAERVINDHKIDYDNAKNHIWQLAKYNYWVLKMDDKENNDNITQYMHQYWKMYSDPDYSGTIDDYLKAVKKKDFKKIESIPIYKSELDTITTLDDIQLEKIAFVMLCIAKYEHEAHPDWDYWINEYKDNVIMSLARVHVPVNERSTLLRQLYLRDFIGMPHKTGKCNYLVKFVSNGENDQIVLELGEADYKELAYTYLYYKNGFSGYYHCSRCGRLVREKKNTPNNAKYCRECAKEVQKEWSRKSSQRFRDKEKSDISDQF